MDLLPYKFLKSGIGKNFIALSFWQVTNYLAPLIVMPYIIRVIGTEKFGVISLIQAINYYFIILVDYGFSISAVREISLYRDNKERLGILFNRTLFTKLILCIISFLLLILVVISVPKFEEYKMSYLSGFLLVVGHALFPIWFFQGIEKMKFTTYLNVFSKLMYVACIFLFVKTPSHYQIVLPLQGISLVIVGMAGLFMIGKRFHIKLKVPGFRTILGEIIKGWPVFISNISVTFYNSSLYLIVGFSVSEKLLGMYSIAEKLSQVLRQVISVFSQAVYPQVCLMASQDHSLVRALWRKMVLPFAIFLFLVCLAISFFAPYIVMVVAGDATEITVDVLRILIWVPFIVFFNVPFFQTLLAYNFNKEVMRVLLACSFVSVMIGYPLVQNFSIFGASFTLIITEILIVMSLATLLERKSGRSIVVN